MRAFSCARIDARGGATGGWRASRAGARPIKLRAGGGRDKRGARLRSPSESRILSVPTTGGHATVSGEASTLASLHVQIGDRFSEFEIAQPIVSIGRGSGSDLRIMDDEVSRDHAKLIRSSRGWEIFDVHSRNGVWVNGKPISGSRQLRHGDRIKLARSVQLTFEDPGSTYEEPPSRESTLSPMNTGRAFAMACDIRDSTTLSGELEPVDYAELLTRWCQRTTEIVEARGGFVDRYMGDGLLACWLDSGERPAEKDAESAMLAALAVVNASSDFTLRLRSLGVFRKFRVAIGIHRGDVVWGRLGAGDRAGFTVTGENISLAFRVLSQAKELDEPILATERALEHVSTEHRFTTVGTVSLKGFPEQYELFAYKFPTTTAWIRLPRAGAAAPRSTPDATSEAEPSDS